MPVELKGSAMVSGTQASRRMTGHDGGLLASIVESPADAILSKTWYVIDERDLHHCR
jgi:hypothetical protein